MCLLPLTFYTLLKGLRYTKILVPMKNDLQNSMQAEHKILKHRCKTVISMASAITSQKRTFQRNKLSRNSWTNPISLHYWHCISIKHTYRRAGNQLFVFQALSLGSFLPQVLPGVHCTSPPKHPSQREIISWEHFVPCVLISDSLKAARRQGNFHREP